MCVTSNAENGWTLARQESIVLVKGPRQVGKSSLLARGLQDARRAGARVALTDLQALNAAEATLAMLDCLVEAQARDDPDLEALVHRYL